MAGIVSSMTAVVSANTAGFTSGMEKARASTNRFQKSAKNIRRTLEKVGKQMTKVGKQMSIAISAPLALLGGLAVKTFADFEQEMAKVQAVSGATGKTFDDLKKLALDLGKSTRFTAGEVANLQLNYSKLGFVPSEIQKITASTLDLALATGEDLADSAEVAGATLRQFGLTAEQMPQVIDVMALSFSSSALTLERFKDAMKSVAPVAAAVGATLEDTTAILGTLVDSGIEASTAGTSLRNIFIELSAKGITWDQAMNKIRASTDKVKTAVELFGKRAAASGLIIAKNEDKIRGLTKSLENAEGSAKSMAKIMDSTLKGSMLRVKSALEGLAISFGESLAPVVKSVGEKIAILANMFQNLTPQTKKFILIAAGIAAAIGPALIALGFLSTTIIPALITGFTLLTGPIGLVVLAIGALAAGFVEYKNRTEAAKSAQQKFNETIVDAEKSVTSEILAINRLVNFAKDETNSRRDRLKALNKLQDQYPDFLKNLTLENIASKNVARSIRAIADSIIVRAKARAAEKSIEKLGLEREAVRETNKELVKKLKIAKEALLIAEKELASGERKIKQSGILAGSGGIAGETAAVDALTFQLKKNLKQTFKLDEEIDLYTKLIFAATDVTDSFTDTQKDMSGSTDKAAKSLKDQTEAIKRFNEAQPSTEAMKFEFLTTGLSEEEAAKKLETIRRANLTLGEKIKEDLFGIGASIQEKFEAIAEAVGQTFGLISDIIGQSIENKMIALENAHARELEMIEQSGQSEEQKQAAILKLDKKTEKERKKLLRRQAVLAKVNAIFNATINAAAGVVRALATGGPILAAIVGALGAVQIGVIASQPIPLQEGGIITRPTTAIIGEAGPEAVIPLSKMDDMGANFELRKVITAENIELVLTRRKKRLSFTS